jgi:hypothetical protein
VLGGVSEDVWPAVVSTGEGDQRHVGCFTEGRPRLLAEAVHEVEDTGRHAGVLEDLPAQSEADSGVNSAGLSTTLLPWPARVPASRTQA